MIFVGGIDSGWFVNGVYEKSLRTTELDFCPGIGWHFSATPNKKWSFQLQVIPELDAFFCAYP